jgi:hypothetical protein
MNGIILNANYSVSSHRDEEGIDSVGAVRVRTYVHTASCILVSVWCRLVSIICWSGNN